MPLVYFGDPILTKRAEDVTAFDDDLKSLIDNLVETVEYHGALGIAAPQVGVDKRVAVVRNEEKYVFLINPEILSFGEETIRSVEGCLSLPGWQPHVTRPARVHIKTVSMEGEEIEIVAEGLFGRACQHEIDHLDGILLFDRVSSHFVKTEGLKKVKKNVGIINRMREMAAKNG